MNDTEDSTGDSPAASKRLAEKLWNAIATSDVDCLVDLLDPKTIWHMPGIGPLAGTYHGIPEVLGLLARIGELSDELESTLVEIFSNQSGAIVRFRVRATRGERVMENEQLFMLHCRDGQIVECTFAPIDQHTHDDFWTPLPDESETEAHSQIRVEDARERGAEVLAFRRPLDS